MANLLTNIAGLSAAAYMGQKSRKENHLKINQMRVARGLPELPWEDAPIDKAVDWVGGKVKSLLAPSANALDATEASTQGGSDDVGAWERLKDGNIDAPGSEAYNRWGKGAEEGAASESIRESRRQSPETASNGMITLEQQAAFPQEMADSLQKAKETFGKADFDNAPAAGATQDAKWNEAMKPTEGFLDNL